MRRHWLEVLGVLGCLLGVANMILGFGNGWFLQTLLGVVLFGLAFWLIWDGFLEF